MSPRRGQQPAMFCVGKRTRFMRRDTGRTMSDRDQKIIISLRRAYEAFNRGDFDAAIEIAHPDVAFVRPGGQSPLTGADAMRVWMEPDALVEQRIEPRAFRVGGDKVLVRQHTSGRGAESGIELELEM